MLKTGITNIQHFNVHDGPGFRTIVFFQGCTLRCKWCQNPETISMTPKILYNPELCIGCGACIDACPVKAITVTDGHMITDHSKCTLCGRCEDECYTLARTLSSKEKTVDEICQELLKDKKAFLISGGGITLSGGEPLIHKDFAVQLLSRIKSQGINTAVETAGNIPTETFSEISELVDTFLFDLKAYTSETHIKWTGVSNALILKNIRFITDHHDNVVIRIPLIPTVNDTDAEFTKMMDFVSTLRHINSVHILPFHNLGSNKYSMLNIPYEMSGFTEDNEERIKACANIAAAHNFKVSVGGTGFTTDKALMKTQHLTK